MPIQNPSYTPGVIAITDGAEVAYYAGSNCAAVYVSESADSAGYPRAFYFRGSNQGSQKQYVPPTTIYRIPGPFTPNQLVGSFELVAAGGDTSNFNFAELPQ